MDKLRDTANRLWQKDKKEYFKWIKECTTVDFLCFCPSSATWVYLVNDHSPGGGIAVVEARPDSVWLAVLYG